MGDKGWVTLVVLIWIWASQMDGSGATFLGGKITRQNNLFLAQKIRQGKTFLNSKLQSSVQKKNGGTN